MAKTRPKCRACGKELYSTARGWVCEDIACTTGIQSPTVVDVFDVDIEERGAEHATVKCPECDGTGLIECEECWGDGERECDMGHMHDCDACKATGEVECNECHGKKIVKRESAT